MQVYLKIFLMDIILTTAINTTDSRKETNLLDIIFNYCYKPYWQKKPEEEPVGRHSRSHTLNAD